ncbi:MAG: glycosyltransferase family 4 protein [Anaerolineae bacterium]
MTRKHRVLYLDAAPDVGGSVISLYELFKGLDRARYEPILVTYAPHAYVDRFRALGAEVIVWDIYNMPDHRPGWVSQARQSKLVQWFRKSRWGSTLYHGLGFGLLLARRLWPRARALQRIICEKEVDLVHTNSLMSHDREGIMAARLAGRPCVCHLRDFERWDWFEKWLARTVSRFIYISEAVQKHYAELGMPSLKGYVVYNGLDVMAFISALDAVKGRQSLGIAQEDLVVGIVGRLDSWKGHRTFLEAMAQVKEVVPNVKGVIVGNPPPNKPQYLDILLALRGELGLENRVIFSGFRTDVPLVMSALDVLVLASTSPEPFGRVLIEAMAAGKPVVAADGGAVREIIDDGVHGLVVPPSDPAALACAIAHLLTQRDQAKAMGQRGQVRAREKFSLQQYVDGVQAVYREVLAG